MCVSPTSQSSYQANKLTSSGSTNLNTPRCQDRPGRRSVWIVLTEKADEAVEFWANYYADEDAADMWIRAVERPH